MSDVFLGFEKIFAVSQRMKFSIKIKKNPGNHMTEGIFDFS